MDYLTILWKLLRLLLGILLPFASAIFVLLVVIGSIGPDIFPPPPAQPWSTIIILVSAIFITTIALVAGAWVLRERFYIKPTEENIKLLNENVSRIEGLAPTLGIMRDRTSLHRLPSRTKWVIGAKLDYPEARIITILDALADDRVKLIAFLCIDTDYSDLRPNIRRLKETLEEKYGKDIDTLKRIVGRIYIREIDPNAINLPMDIYDPYVKGKTNVAIYFPHSNEFIRTDYDTGFLVTDIHSHERGPTSYFVAKAEWLWHRSRSSEWSKYKGELGILEDWDKVVPGILYLNESKTTQLRTIIEQSAVDFLADLTGISTIAVECFLQEAREREIHVTQKENHINN